ncbi:MAG: BRO family protein [Candidatus Fonsibacter sp.]
MSDMVEFSFNNTTIACIAVNGDPWFKSKDVATILEYTNTNKAIIDNMVATSFALNHGSPFTTIQAIVVLLKLNSTISLIYIYYYMWHVFKYIF